MWCRTVSIMVTFSNIVVSHMLCDEYLVEKTSDFDMFPLLQGLNLLLDTLKFNNLIALCYWSLMGIVDNTFFICFFLIKCFFSYNKHKIATLDFIPTQRLYGCTWGSFMTSVFSCGLFYNLFSSYEYDHIYIYKLYEENPLITTRDVVKCKYNLPNILKINN